MQQNEGWEEEEPGAGITSSAWSGAHGSLVEVSRKALPNGEIRQLVCFVSSIESWRIHGEILSLVIAYPDRTLTPIL